MAVDQVEQIAVITVDELEAYFNEIYKYPPKDHELECLIYPVLEVLYDHREDDEGWLKRDDIQTELKAKPYCLGVDWGRVGLALDHTLSKKFAQQGKPLTFLDRIFEYQAEERNGAKKIAYKIRDGNLNAVEEFFNNTPDITAEKIKGLIQARINYLVESSEKKTQKNKGKEDKKRDQIPITTNHSFSFKSPLNQILYGPPGTGKTFNTLKYALKIFEGTEIPDGVYEVQKVRFEKLKSDGRIEFVTFHQSFSYEDFVEGIRADTNTKGELSYAVKDGVFKKLAIEAMYSRLSKASVDKYIKEFNESIKDSAPQDQISINDIQYEDKKNILSRCDNSELVENSGEPFVLIVDEINRGNTSRIFGELITLIESTKRMGSKETIEVILPYSQEKFVVPDNLYIIGTMNTADRSLALIDTALRRRFDFIEMPAQPHLIKNTKEQKLMVGDIDIQEMLKTINSRIEVIYDREHTIGHAFFMELKDDPSINMLALIFKNKILPLLEEYFFEDWEKIIKVLGGSGIYTKFPIPENLSESDSNKERYTRRPQADLDSWLLMPDTYKNIYPSPKSATDAPRTEHHNG